MGQILHKRARTGDKTNITSNSNEEIASNIIAKNDIVINSGLALPTYDDQDGDCSLRGAGGCSSDSVNRAWGNTNIKGNIISNEGDITIISANDTNIEAIKSTNSTNTKSEGFSTTVTLGASYGKSSAQQILESTMGQLSLRESNSDEANKNYTNTLILAENGTIKINSLDDASIKGADLLAENIILNTGDDLTIESLQNTSHSKSKSTSFGVGGGQSGGNISYNAQRSEFNRDWVDDQTSIIGTNSIIINTGDSTNIKGALVANIENATLETIGIAQPNNVALDDEFPYGEFGGCASDSECRALGSNKNQANWIDGGNLIINTNSLTFENIIDNEKQESSSVGISLSKNFKNSNSGNSGNAGNGNIGNGNQGNGSLGNIGNGNIGNSQNQSQQNNYYPKGSLNLSLQDEGYEKEQITKATIGEGTITTNAILTFDTNKTSPTYGDLISNIGGTTLENTDPQLTNLNRDITNSQEITKDTITGALDINATIDLRLLSTDGRKEILQELKHLPNNLPIVAGQLADLAGAIPLSPVWGSRWIDVNNNEIDPETGKPINNPAPNLWTGNPFDKNDEPSVGRGDLECKNSGLCKNLMSDEAYHLRVLHYGIPGFKSFSQFHDSAMLNADGTEKGGFYKFVSIVPYMPINYYGAVGTILDFGHFNKNSSQNN